MEQRIGTIHPPELPEHLPGHSQWLSGQGAGTWFCLDETTKELTYRIRRYTPEGSLDCDRLFKQEPCGSIFDIQQPYQFTHISHCATCRIEQQGTVFTFNYIET